MNKPQRLLLLAMVAMAFLQCQYPNATDPIPEIPQIEKNDEFHTGTTAEYNGNAIAVGTVLTSPTSENALNNVQLPRFTKDLTKGLKYQLKVLNYRKKEQLKTHGKFDPSIEKLEETVRLLLDQQNADLPNFSKTLNAVQLADDDENSSVYFTGYYTPVLKVSHIQTEEFKYPIYARPQNWVGKLPTRRQIDGDGVLKDQGLEIAYTKNLLDIYFMQIQGSGIVEYPDGSNQILAFAGTNGRKYRSVGKYMLEHGYANAQNISLKRIKKFFNENPDLIDPLLFVNESYVFFSLVKYQKTPKGAGHVPLTTEYSIAVDKKYIPIGSCLLAKVPIIDKNNRIDHYDYRILIAQDVGGAIKGPRRVDLYTGVGEKGRQKASSLHHYGNLWLLEPKQNDSNKKPKVTASL